MHAKAFKEEDAQRPLAEPQPQLPPEQPQQEENLPIQRPHVFSHEMEERQVADEPVTQTFRRNFEAENQ